MGIFDFLKSKTDAADGKPTAETDVKALVESIIDDLDNGALQEDEQRKLVGMGFSEEQSSDILDMIQMAYQKVTAHAGVPSGDMFSKGDKEPCYLAALEVFLKRMPVE